MKPIENPALPPGSVVLVTGVNGLIGSHVADQLLQHEYKIRGTVRSVPKNKWMVQFFETKFGAGLFELVEVADITVEGAFDSVIKGVSGVIHVASIVNLDPDPSTVIPTVVNGTLSILKSAAKEASVKRFVLTSSATAVTFPKRDNKVFVTPDSWNEESVTLAQNLPVGMSDMGKGLIVYGASKVKGEQAMWKWVRENETGLVVNSVVPGGNFGRVLSPENQGFPSTTLMAAALYANNHFVIDSFVTSYPPEWFVDVQDNARLHVAALIHPTVSNERVFAYTSSFNWNIVLEAFRKLFPDREFIENVPGLWIDESVCEPAKRAEALLREMGVTGFTTLEESLRMNVESF